MDDKLTTPSSSLPTLQEMQGKYLIAAIERKNKIAKQDDEEFESIVKLMDKVASLGYYSYVLCKNDLMRFAMQEDWIKPLPSFVSHDVPVNIINRLIDFGFKVKCSTICYRTVIDDILIPINPVKNEK